MHKNILLLFATAISVFSIGSVEAHTVKCEPWGTDEARCLVRKEGHEGEIKDFLKAQAKKKVAFKTEGYFSTCGFASATNKQFSHDLSKDKDENFQLYYTLGPTGIGCFEIFFVQCKSGGTATDCYESFTFRTTE